MTGYCDVLVIGLDVMHDFVALMRFSQFDVHKSDWGVLWNG